MLGARVIEQYEWRWVFTVSAVLIVLLLLPFVFVYGIGSDAYQFMGVLVNPIDGMSYLAKMQQGYDGSWLFKLAYTPEKHDGVFLYTFYLGLGHLARALGVSNIMIFHISRLVGNMVMFLAFYRFVADWTDDISQRRLTWLLGMTGAGLGWVALLFGHLTPDLLVIPEAFPFQAGYTNSHFPWSIGMGLLLVHLLVTTWLGEGISSPELNIYSVGIACATLCLVSMSPYILLPVGIGFAGLFVWLWVRDKAFPRKQLGWGGIVILFMLPHVVYDLWVFTEANPLFRDWMSQNQTPSPPVWDYLIAFGPLLILAVIGLWGGRFKLQDGDILLIAWFCATLVLLYAPLGIQRRFTMLLIAPVAVFAGRGLWRVILAKFKLRIRIVITVLVFIIFMPTTVVALIGPIVGSFDLLEQGGGRYFMNHAEVEAVEWLADTDPGTLVLASPEMGTFLPVYGMRVVYGHQYETIDADLRKQAVEAFYAGIHCQVVEDEQVDYILVGPREQALTGELTMCAIHGNPVFTSGDGEVVIYARDGG